MKLSDEKRLSLVSKIVDALYDDKTLSLAAKDRQAVFQQVRKAFDRDAAREHKAEANAVQKLTSIKRGIREGSSEWETRLRSLREEELSKTHPIKKW